MAYLTIHDLDIHGRGIGRTDKGKVYFCEGTLPGERWSVTPIPDTRPAQAKPDSCFHVSPDRQTPPCPFFYRCGGCTLQHLSYEATLRHKHDRVRDQLERIGDLDPELIDATAQLSHARPSPEPFHYRNHVQYHVAWPSEGAPHIGFHGRHSRAVVDQSATGCMLAAPIAERIRQAAARQWGEADFEAITQLIVRHSERTKEVLVILVGSADRAKIRAWGQWLSRNIAPYTLTGLACRDRSGKPSEAIFGELTYREHMDGLELLVHGDAFFQVNTPQMDAVLGLMRAWVRLSVGSRTKILDLYGGTGLLGLNFARQGADVTVVDRTAAAAPTGRAQAALNGVSERMQFMTEDAGAFAKGSPSAWSSTEVVITDPPRAGLDRAVIRRILDADAQTWIYMSCDPATLARDIARMTSEADVLGRKPYRVQAWQVVDMFPWTGHVECVCLLTRNEG